MDGPRDADDADRNRNGDGKFQEPRALPREHPMTVLGISGSRANDEKELPGKGIEVPRLIVRIAVRPPTEAQCQEIERAGEDQWQRQAPLQQQQHHGKHPQQNHVDRQDVEELRLILQQKDLDDRDLRFVDKIIDPKILAIGLMEAEGCVTHLRGKNHEYEDVCDIELPNPATDLARCGDSSMSLQSPSINRGRGVTRDKDKDLSSVGKCDRMQRYIRQDIIWNVVDENEKERQTAKEVEPQIAPALPIEIGIGGAVPRAVLASVLGQLPDFTHVMQRAPFRRRWLSWSMLPPRKNDPLSTGSVHCLAPSQKCYRNPTGFTQVGPRFGVCESSVLTNGEPVCLVCLSVHHENIGMFVTHDFKAHSPPPPAQRNTRTGSVAAGWK